MKIAMMRSPILGLAGIDANAIKAMIEGETSLKPVSQY
jgi:hypothetical protein